MYKKIVNVSCLISLLAIILTGCESNENAVIKSSQSPVETLSVQETTKVKEKVFPYPDQKETGTSPALATYMNKEGNMEILMVQEHKKAAKMVCGTLIDGKWTYKECDWKGDKETFTFSNLLGVVVEPEKEKMYINFSLEEDEEENQIFYMDLQEGKIKEKKLKGFEENLQTTGDNAPTIRAAKGDNVVIQFSEYYSVVYNTRMEQIVSEYAFDLYDCKLTEESLYVYREGMLREYNIQDGKETCAYYFENGQAKNDYICYAVSEEEELYVFTANGIYETTLGESRMEKVGEIKQSETVSDSNVYVYDLYVNTDGELYTYSIHRETGQWNISKWIL